MELPDPRDPSGFFLDASLLPCKTIILSIDIYDTVGGWLSLGGPYGLLSSVLCFCCYKTVFTVFKTLCFAKELKKTAFGSLACSRFHKEKNFPSYSPDFQDVLCAGKGLC